MDLPILCCFKHHRGSKKKRCSVLPLSATKGQPIHSSIGRLGITWQIDQYDEFGCFFNDFGKYGACTWAGLEVCGGMGMKKSSL